MLLKPSGFVQSHETKPLCLRDGGKIISAENSVKLLGVILEPRMKFFDFVTRKIQKCNFHLSNLRAIRKSIPQDVRIILVTNLICSTLDYCNALLLCSPKFLIAKLQKTLNDGIRFIFDLRRREHISPFLYKLHVLPVEYRIKFKVSLIAFKILNGTAPSYLIDKATTYKPTTNRPTRPGSGRDKFMFECTLSMMKRDTWMSKMMFEWNQLPIELRMCQSIELFKSKLKTYYFEQAF